MASYSYFYIYHRQDGTTAITNCINHGQNAKIAKIICHNPPIDLQRSSAICSSANNRGCEVSMKLHTNISFNGYVEIPYAFLIKKNTPQIHHKTRALVAVPFRSLAYSMIFEIELSINLCFVVNCLTEYLWEDKLRLQGSASEQQYCRFLIERMHEVFG
jgi:hypothetical protein